MRHLTLRRESWPIAGSFTISRGSKTAADVVVAEIAQGEIRGRGECVPYPRYGESGDSVVEQIEALRGPLEAGLSRVELQDALAPGAARNALDCALWDLDAKRAGRRVWELAGLAPPAPALTAYTLSLDTADRMASRARACRRPLLKLKVGGAEDLERMRAVRRAAPEAQLIVDANEGWSPEDLARLMPELAALGIALLEQPLAAAADGALAEIERLVPVCADESCHDTASLNAVVGRYDVVNIKLDKTGGLTEAIALADAAEAAGLDLMVGCMVATSLAMAPALMLAPRAAYLDLDGPLMLAEDRRPGLSYEGSVVQPPPPELWG